MSVQEGEGGLFLEGGAAGGGVINGGGVANRLARWVNATTINASLVTDDGAGNLGAISSAAFGALPAASGIIRGSDGFSILVQNGGVDRNVIRMTAGVLQVGGNGAARPANIFVDAQSQLSLALAGLFYIRLDVNRVLLTRQVQFQLAGMFATQTLAANRALAATGEARWQRLDAGGADRTVQLPLADATNVGAPYEVINTSNGDELLTVLGNGAVPIVGGEIRAGGRASFGLGSAASAAFGGRGVASFAGLQTNVPTAQGPISIVTHDKLLTWTLAQPEQNGTSDLAGDQLVTDIDAIYTLLFALSFSSDILSRYEYAVFINGAITTLRQTISTTTLGIAGESSVAASARLFVPAAATIDLRVISGTVGTTITISHAQLGFEKAT